MISVKKACKLNRAQSKFLAKEVASIVYVGLCQISVQRIMSQKIIKKSNKNYRKSRKIQKNLKWLLI